MAAVARAVSLFKIWFQVDVHTKRKCKYTRKQQNGIRCNFKIADPETNERKTYFAPFQKSICFTHFTEVFHKFQSYPRRQEKERLNVSRTIKGRKREEGEAAVCKALIKIYWSFIFNFNKDILISVSLNIVYNRQLITNRDKKGIFVSYSVHWPY